MSYGVVGINTPSFKVIQNIQRYKRVHIHDKAPHAISLSRNVEPHEVMCDMVMNMDRPRTIMTFLPNEHASAQKLQQLSIWCDKGDSIINMSNENFANSKKYDKMFYKKDIYYTGGFMSGSAIITSGDDYVYSANELFYNTFSQANVHLGNDPCEAHKIRMIHNTMECALFQGYADIFGYYNQSPTLAKVLSSNKLQDIDGPIRARSIGRFYESIDINDVVSINKMNKWCSQYALKKEVPIPTLQSALNTRITSRFMKFINATQPYNKWIDDHVLQQTLRFVYAMVYFEGYCLSRNIANCITSTTLDCDIFEAGEFFDIIHDTSIYARTFCIHCAQSNIPAPVVQAALCQYDIMKQKRSSMSFIASLMRE